jgi:hypothetical protein
MEKNAAAAIFGFVKPRQTPASSFVKSCQVSSSPVKFRQVPSSLVKPLLDGDFCNFNDLPGKSLTEAPRLDRGRPTPPGPVSSDETRITRPSPPAKTLSRQAPLAAAFL